MWDDGIDNLKKTSSCSHIDCVNNIGVSFWKEQP